MSGNEKKGKRGIGRIEERVSRLERDVTLLASGRDEPAQFMEVKGDFFQVMNALRSLYLDEEDDRREIERLSLDIEQGNVQVDMADLFFRFFIRQEIQNARVKLLLLSQKYKVNGELFDKLDDLQILIDDPRHSVHQVVIGWKTFEKAVSAEIARLREKQKR